MSTEVGVRGRKYVQSHRIWDFRKSSSFLPFTKTGENKTFIGKKTKPGTSFFLNSDIEKRYFQDLIGDFIHTLLFLGKEK